VKKAAGNPQADWYCDACDHMYSQRHRGRHVVAIKHTINVEKKRKAMGMGPKERVEYSCKECDYKTWYPANWRRHLECQRHRSNAGKGEQDEEDIYLHAPTPESLVSGDSMDLVESVELVEVEKEEEYEDDGFGEEGYEDYTHYCDDCDVTYAGAKWARHLTSAGHVFNVLRNSPGDEEMASDEEEEEEEEEEESMADYDSATDGESIVYDDATDEDSASPSPSPSPSPSSEEDNVSNEGITFPRDGTPVADLASPTSPSSFACAEFPSEEDFYCETCNVTILSADAWEIDEHMADHAYEVSKQSEVVQGDWLSQLREAAGMVKDVEVEGMEGVEEVQQGGMECEYNGWAWKMGVDGKVLGTSVD